MLRSSTSHSDHKSSMMGFVRSLYQRASTSNGLPATRDQLADFTRDYRILLLSAMAVIIGVISALVAYALVWLIGVITNLAYYLRFSSSFISPANNHLGYFAILVPIISGIIVGLMARYGSEQIRGHGIPEALETILIGRSKMPPKIAILKPLSSAISIGMGGPFGAEGPIIMTGGAFGSLFAQLFNLSSAERKTLLVAGAAGGMAAIFSTPLAAVLISVELLLFELKPRSLIPVAIASVVAAAVRVPLLGPGPIFPMNSNPPLGWAGLWVSGGIGVIAGFGSGLLTMLVYGFEDLFRKLPIHWMWWPAIGGLFIGIGGLIQPQALGVGYDTIRALLANQLTIRAVMLLLVVKILIWSLALGSGTSGGVLAPLLIMGGALGAIEAHWIPFGTPVDWVLISMTAIMGGTMRSPLTAVVFSLELTHNLNLLPALLFGAIASDAVTVLLLRRSILTEKVARRGHHLFREYSVDPLEMVRVGEVMDPHPPMVTPDTTVKTLAERMLHEDPRLTRRAVMIVDENNHLIGIITRGDVMRALENAEDQNMNVLQAGARNLIVAYPDELLSDAAARMLMNNLGRLPVVDRADSRRLLGYVGRAEIMKARMRQIQGERVREGSLFARHRERRIG